MRSGFNPLPLLAALIPIAAAAHFALTHTGAPGAAPITGNGHEIVRLLLRYGLLIGIGVMGLLLGAGHVLAPGRTAAHIGWTPSAPFQFELGFANWAFAALGLIAFRASWSFQAATVTGFTVFYWGCAWLHWRELLREANRAPGNAGFMLWWDTLFPAALLAALWITR